ncbi:MAG: Cu(I)-responsive transcriptional regulator [Tateyamaria sp.]|jgi:MerR family copper efflux transcriptional regulator|nr:Cu(I)-responsive transcriptional regulator [Tateyamaria sp.]MCH9747420.1 Cu(I)-responsive transcriptional regulator [Alphaproteobacteria bacterium]MBT5303260.1 Cu(I)-responsive transcriptional regulator [Tateyamaria sp.]MBT6343109.1 Cu(I)-responsive transcriptional regulator [Tateyamaria sp.]MBT7446441.1 Cu(I)-responsive transcriptional regulator [Tateyamaria sp.]
MNISEVAKVTDLSVKTIRYYEEIGLVTPHRSSNGYRSFDKRETHKLQFLASARALGFSIENCRSLLALWVDRSRASADVKQIAQDHLTEIEEKIISLRDMQITLQNLVRACAGDARPDCPILQGLSK